MDGQDKVTLFQRVFRGRQDAYGEGDGNCIRKPVTNQLISRHLRGLIRIGQYPLSPDILNGEGVMWCAADVDNHGLTGLDTFNDKHDTMLSPLYVVSLMADKAHELGVVPYCERSKSGAGCHVFLFFDEPVKAVNAVSLMRCLCDYVEQETGYAISEVFPKQVKLANDTSVGNYINLPLNGKELIDKGFTAFFDPKTGIVAPDQWDVLQDICSNMIGFDMLGMLIESGEVAVVSTAKDDKGYVKTTGMDYVAILRGELSDKIGGRTDHLVRLAGHWWQIGLWVDEAVELAQAWDIRNDLGLDADPQYAGKYGKLGKVEGTIRDIYRRNDTKAAEIKEDVESKGKLLVPVESMYVDEFQAIVKAGYTRRVKLHPMPRISSAINDMRPGDVGIVLARPSVGKSLLGQTIAHEVAMKQEMRVAFFSMEMSGELVVSRAASMLTGWSPATIEDIILDEQDDPIRHRLDEYKGTFLVSTAGALTLMQIRDELMTDQRIGFAVLDYLGLIVGDGRSIYERTSSVARGLKVLAKDTSTAVLCLAQINRSGQDGEPVTLNMGRDSGAIEEGADYVIGMWQDDIPGVTKAIKAKLLKNRRGISGVTETMLFQNYMLVAMHEEATNGSDTSNTDTV